MKCDLCNKKATVHLTEIVDEQMTEMHLCEDCAREKSVQMEQQFGLADLLAGLADFGKQVKKDESVNLKCTNCGMSYEDFRKFGRLGCSECYPSFKMHLATLLKKIHGANQHFGKTPVKMPPSKKKKIENNHHFDKKDNRVSKYQESVISENTENHGILKTIPE